MSNCRHQTATKGETTMKVLQRFAPVLFLAFASACSNVDDADLQGAATPLESAKAGDDVGASWIPLKVCGQPPICPFGYTPGERFCSLACEAQGFDCRFGPNQLMCYPVVLGNVDANPTTVVIDTNVTTIGTTSVCWGVTNSVGQVWVSMDGAAESLFGQGFQACQSAPWIQVNHNYAFRLYAGTAHSQLLDSVTVVGVAAGGGGNVCDSCPAGRSCFCGDNVCRVNGTDCP
jgi:hypothetical protein